MKLLIVEKILFIVAIAIPTLVGCRTTEEFPDRTSTIAGTADGSEQVDLNRYWERVAMGYAAKPSYANALPLSQLEQASSIFRKASIEFLVLHNKRILDLASPASRQEMATQIYDQRVDICMMNPIGKQNSTAKRWFYCHMPLEFRLCNSVVLLGTQELASKEKLDLRMTHFQTCMKENEWTDGRNFLAAFDAYGSVSSLETNSKRPSDRIVEIYRDFYLNEDLTVYPNENSELESVTKWETIKRWAKINDRGEVVGMRKPPSNGGRRPLHLLLHWRSHFKFLNKTDRQPDRDDSSTAFLLSSPDQMASEVDTMPESETEERILDESTEVNGSPL